MNNEMDQLTCLKKDLNNLYQNNPDFYKELEYIASLTRQLSIPYKYLGSLLFSNKNIKEIDSRPELISDSVLHLFETEVQKVKLNNSFQKFNRIIGNYTKLTYPQVFLMILGAEPSFVFNNTIIK